jgi:hypothetical protein
MFVTRKHLSRRTFLRSTAGSVLALPMLSAMVPALAAQSRVKTAAPLRFGAVYMPNGVYPPLWHPDAAGKDFVFKPIMQPLESVRQHLVTISQLQAPFGSLHLGASAAWLNGVGPVQKATDLDAIESRKTVDQFIADKIAGDTPLRSLELGTEDMGTSAGACDGFPCVFFNTLSWRDDTSPLPVGVNPRVTFERMFGETGSSAQRLARLKQKRSMLDWFTGEITKMRQSLGAADNAIFDDYLTNVREVEQQLARMEARANVIVDTPDSPRGIPEAFDDHMSVTYNLMRLAFRADITRVFTFLIGVETTGRGYAHIGVPDRHHTVSHHGNKPDKVDAYVKICTYQVRKFAEFVERLRSTADGDGTLLDHSLLYWGSGMSDGNPHDRHNPPALLVGGAHGRLKGNRHIVAAGQPTANLLLALTDMAGVEVGKVGASSSKLAL